MELAEHNWGFLVRKCSGIGMLITLVIMYMSVSLHMEKAMMDELESLPNSMIPKGNPMVKIMEI